MTVEQYMRKGMQWSLTVLSFCISLKKLILKWIKKSASIHLPSPGERKHNCTAKKEMNLWSSIEYLYITGNQLYDVGTNLISTSEITRDCLNKCKPNYRELQWNFKLDSPPLPTNNALHFCLSMPTTLELKKMEINPLSNLLSDIGGSLGLLFGSSLWDMWIIIFSLLIQQLDRFQGFLAS